jgi:hypothetical protein
MLSVDMPLLSAVYALYHFVYCYVECQYAECVGIQHNDIQHDKNKHDTQHKETRCSVLM